MECSNIHTVTYYNKNVKHYFYEVGFVQKQQPDLKYI